MIGEWERTKVRPEEEASAGALVIYICLQSCVAGCCLTFTIERNHKYVLKSKITVVVVSCRYEYHWADGTNIKKPIKCSAPKYIDYLMTWVQDQLDDETLFPSKIGMLPVIIPCPSTTVFVKKKKKKEVNEIIWVVGLMVKWWQLRRHQNSSHKYQLFASSQIC